MSEFDAQQSSQDSTDNQSLIRALGETVPQAERAFRDNLEEQLMARLSGDTSSMSGDEKIMRLNNKSKQKRNGQSSRVPITLVAAILAIVVVGGILMLLQESPIQATQATQVSCDYARETKVYIAHSGDTIESISNLFGVPVDTLREINCSNDIDDILVGTRIQIPSENFAMGSFARLFEDCDYSDATNFVYHIAETGQSMENILRAYHLNVQEIMDANCFGQVAMLQDGDVLRIPITVESETVNDSFDMVVAISDIQIGETITRDMLEVVQRSHAFTDAVLPFCCVDYIVGRTAEEAIQEGSIIEEQMLSDLQIDSVQMLDVVTVSQFIPSGTEITEDAVEISQFPINLVPNGTFEDEQFVIGRYATTDMYQGDIVFFERLSQEPVPNANGYPLVIARRDIALNEVITEDMITTIFISNDFMNELQPPERSYMSVISSSELAIGQIANTFIPQFSPVRMEHLSSAEDCSNMFSDVCTAYVLPDGLVAVAIPIANPLPLTLGQQVDVLGAMLFVEADADHDTQPDMVITDAAIGATLITMDGDSDTMMATIVVSPQEAEVLVYMAEAQIPMRLVPHMEQRDGMVQAPMPEYALTEDGLAQVSIPFDRIAEMREAIEVGSVVNVSLILEASQYSPSNGELLLGTTFNSNWYATLYQAPVIYIGTGDETYPNPNENDELFVVFGVQLVDAPLVDWYIKQGATLSLQNIVPND